MKKLFLLLLLLVNILLIAEVEENWDYQNPFSFSHELTGEEALLYENYDRDFQETDPPAGPVRPIAEWESMKAVMVRYPLGIPVSLVAQFTEYIPVICVVSSGQQSSANSAFQSAGADMGQISYMTYPTDTYWCRDYGPWFVAYGDEEIGICNFKYNRPRPNDDDIPMLYAQEQGLEWFGMNLEQTGGNYMADGVGHAVCTDLVVEENPTLSLDEINQKMEDYLGVTTYHISEDPLGDYIKHVDCWGKYLDVDKILISRVPASHAQYDEYEAVADYFANVTSSYGTPMQVFRADVPGNNQATPFSNSLILNGKVFVPVTGTSYDEAALAVYEEAMPGYEIIAVDEGPEDWLNTDALHCRTHEIADDGMLYISHMPLNAYPANEDIIINAEFIDYSDAGLVDDQLKLVYKIGTGDYTEVVMTQVAGNSYQATIPAQPALTEVSYYLHGEDLVGKVANHPYIGAPDPHIFQTGSVQITVPTSVIDLETTPGSQIDSTFLIENSGELELNFNIDYTASLGTREEFQYNVANSPAANAYDYNTFDENDWATFTVDQTNFINIVTVDFNWDTDNYGSEGSFHMESPIGTHKVIGTDISEGNQSISFDNFSGELMSGEWKIWIEDSYGDGGHQVTNVVVTVSTLSAEETWLTVSPIVGTVVAGESLAILVEADASQLEAGNYSGNIHITSNASNISELNIPVNFIVAGTYAGNEEVNASSRISSNYPNPFNPETTISYSIMEEGNVKLEIYNIRGQKVKTLVNEVKSAGSFKANWNGIDDESNSVASGIYFAKLRTTGTTNIKKMILMK